MPLTEIFRPIRKEMADIERLIRAGLTMSANPSLAAISDHLLRLGGKRLRPGLVMLSVKAVHGSAPALRQAVRIGGAFEMVHLASLIHDDVVDHALMRRNKPTVNSKWGNDMALILGDYLYSLGFDLISACGCPHVLTCFSRATRLMCEGELVQVCERDNAALLKERYLAIIKKKTANLFAASCESGVLAAGRGTPAQSMLREYGLNFGIAFQIVDDSLDLIGDVKRLGKTPGADFKIGELTLPFIHLLSEFKDKDKGRRLIARKKSDKAFKEIRRIFINSRALAKTREDIGFYIEKAKGCLGGLRESTYRRSLLALADHIAERMPA